MQIWYTCLHNTSNKSIIFIRISLFSFDISGYRKEIHFLLRKIFACVWELQFCQFCLRSDRATHMKRNAALCASRLHVNVLGEWEKIDRLITYAPYLTVCHYKYIFGSVVTLFQLNECMAEKERRKNRIYKLTMALTELKKTHFIAFPMCTTIGFHVKHMNPFGWEVNPRQCVHDERWSDTQIHGQGQAPKRKKLWSIGCSLWMNACVSNWIDD